MISYIEFYLRKVKCFVIRLPKTPKPIPTADEIIKFIKIKPINFKKSIMCNYSSSNNSSPTL